jgi:hypothetical protein
VVPAVGSQCIIHMICFYSCYIAQSFEHLLIDPDFKHDLVQEKTYFTRFVVRSKLIYYNGRVQVSKQTASNRLDGIAL